MFVCPHPITLLSGHFSQLVSQPASHLTSLPASQLPCYQPVEVGGGAFLALVEGLVEEGGAFLASVEGSVEANRLMAVAVMVR